MEIKTAEDREDAEESLDDLTHESLLLPTVEVTLDLLGIGQFEIAT